MVNNEIAETLEKLQTKILFDNFVKKVSEKEMLALVEAKLEIKRLESKNHHFGKLINELQLRNDELNELNKRASIEAGEQFADRLYKKLGVTKNYAIDEVLREMVSDDNG